MANKINLEGELGLKIVLDNIKETKEQLKQLQVGLGDAGKSKSKKDPTKTIAEASQIELDAAKNFAAAGKELIRKSEATINEFRKSGRDLNNLTSKQNARLQSAIGGFANGVENLTKSSKIATTLLPDIKDSKARTLLRDTLNKNAALQIKAKKELDQINPELGKVAAARKAENESIRKANKARDVRTAIEKQRTKEEIARSALGKRLRGAPTQGQIDGLTPTGKASVGDALKGRVDVAKSQLTAANQLGLSDGTKEVFAAQLRKANAELATFKDRTNTAAEAVRKLRLEEKAYAQRDREQKDISKRDAAEYAAKAKQEDQLAKLAQKTRKEEAAAAKLDAERKDKADKKAKDLQEKELARRQAIRNQELRASAVARQKELDASLRSAKKKRAQVIAEEKKITAALKKEQDQRNKERRDVDIKKQIAGDVFEGYGAKGFKDLDISSVSRENIGALQEYAKAEQNAAKAILNRAEQQGKSRATVNALSKDLQRHTKVVRQLKHRFRELNSPLQQVNLLFRQFFRFAIGYGALYQVLGAIRALATGVLDLNEQLFNIQAITASTNKEMSQLEGTIKRIAVTTKFTTTEISAATQILGQAGVVAKDLPGALQATADFAAATGSQLEIAADLITTARNVFKELDDSTIADQLTKSINISKLTAQDLKTILSLSAQTADSFNLTSEQYLSAVTTLRNAGIKASTVATGLRQGLIEIFTPDTSSVKVLKKRYRQLGEIVTEEAVKQRFFGFTKADNPLLAVLSELKRIGFADDAQKEFTRAFDVRAANAIKALIKNYDELAEAETKITFGLSAAEAADIQMKSLNNSMKNLGAAFTVFGSQVLSGGVDILETFTDKVTDAITELTKLDLELKSQGKKGLGAALIPALLGGVAGGFAGRSVKGKILGTLLGTAAGGAAGIGGAGGGPGGETSLSGAVGTAGLLGLTGYLAGPSIYKGGKSVVDSITDFKTTPKGGLPGGRIPGGIGGGKVAQFIAKNALGRGVLAAIPALGPFSAALVSIIAVVLSFSGLLSDASSPAQAAAFQAEEALAKLDNTQAELAKLQAFSDEFDVEGARAGDFEGKAANSVVAFQDAVKESDESIAKVFGDLDAATDENVKGLLQKYAKGNLATRKSIGVKIREASGVDLKDDEFDKVLFAIGTSIGAIDSSAKAFGGQFASLFTKAQEVIEEAVISGRDLEAPEFASSRAVLEVFRSNDDFIKLIRGQTDRLSGSVVDVVTLLSNSLAAVNEETIEALKKVEAEAIENKVRTGIRLAVESANATNILLLETQLDNITTAGKLVGEEAANYLAIVAKVLQEEQLKLADDFDRYEADLKATRYLGTPEDRDQNQRDEFIGEGATETTAIAKPLVDQALLEVADKQANILAQNQELIADKLLEDIATIEFVSEQLALKAGQVEGKAELVGLGGELGEILEDVLASPANAAETIKATYGKYLKEDSYKIGENGEADYTNGAAALGSLIDLLVKISQSINNTIQGEKEYERLLGELPAEEDLILVDTLDRTIKKLTSRKAPDKAGRNALTDPSNPNNLFNIRARAKERIQQTVIAQIENDINDLAGKGDEKVGKLDKAGAQRLIDLRVALAKANADLLDIPQAVVDDVKRLNEEIEKDRIAKAKQLAELNIEVANRQIELSGAAGDIKLFNDSLAKINKNRADLRKEIEKELVIEGFIKGTDLFKGELEARQFILRDIEKNSEEFGKALETFTSGLREQAALLRNAPITLGAANDAFSARQGTVGDARRAQEASLNLGAVAKEREAAKVKIKEEQRVLPGQDANEAAKTQLRIDELNQSLVKLEQEAFALTITMLENSSVAKERAQAEIAQILRIQTLKESLQDSEFAFKNLAETINDTFITAVEGIGDAIARVVLDGDSFKELIGNLLNDIGRDLATRGIQTVVNELATTALSALPEGLTTLLGGAAEGATTAVTDTAAGALEGAAESSATVTAVGAAVTASLLPATLGLQTANTQMFLAGTTLNTAAGALITAAGALGAAAGAEAGGGIIGDLAGAVTTGATTARRGGILGGGGIQSYAKGTAGIISGPGTGTSDSILAAYLSSKGATPIRVSDGESIITEEGTKALGEDFIHMLNKTGKLPRFNTGAVAENQGILASSAKPAQQAAAAVSPAINNRNETTIVNAIDSSSVVSAALETPAGGRAIMNYMRANKSKLSRILQ